MNCKNCKHVLLADSKFCKECGAKVVTHRMTISVLYKDVLKNIFVWDNKYFKTIAALISKPKILLQEYLSGTRGKYTSPFTFFAIGIAISLLVFNYFKADYINATPYSNARNIDETTLTKDSKSNDTRDIKDIKWIRQINEFELKYFNYIEFLLLPLLALISLWVFGKPYNYAEHLIINAYLQGVLLLSIALVFLIELFSPKLFGINYLIAMAFYLYVYGKLYELTFGKAIIKLLKFLGIMALIIFISVAIGLLAKSFR